MNERIIVFFAGALTGKDYPVKKDGCSKFIWMMVISSIVNPCLNVFVVYPNDPLDSRFLYHFIANDTERTPLFYVYGFMEFIGQIFAWHPWMLIFFLIWTHSKSTSYWLKQMR